MRFIVNVQQAERMMTQAAVKDDGIEITFADGCTGLVPFSEIPEISNLTELNEIELPNPYQVNLIGKNAKSVELPWDFVRHYCDTAYRLKAEEISLKGKKSLGERIRTLREKAGITQLELARAAGIGRVTEVRIENGEQSPRYDTLLTIAQALKQPLDVLLTSESRPQAYAIAEKKAKYKTN